MKHISNIRFNIILKAGFKLQALSMVMPGRIGDIGLIYFLKDKLNTNESLALLLIDKIITLFIAGFLASIGICYFYKWIYGLAFFVAYIFFFTVLILIIRKDVVLPVEGQNKFKKIIINFREQIAKGVSCRSGIAINFIFTLFRIVLSAFSFVLVISWFGINVSIWDVILVQAVVQIATILPISYMGIGLVEVINIHLLGKVGVDASIILAASLALRSIQVLFYLFIFFIWLRPSLKKN